MVSPATNFFPGLGGDDFLKLGGVITVFGLGFDTANLGVDVGRLAAARTASIYLLERGGRGDAMNDTSVTNEPKQPKLPFLRPPTNAVKGVAFRSDA